MYYEAFFLMWNDCATSRRKLLRKLRYFIVILKKHWFMLTLTAFGKCSESKSRGESTVRGLREKKKIYFKKMNKFLKNARYAIASLIYFQSDFITRKRDVIRQAEQGALAAASFVLQERKKRKRQAISRTIFYTVRRERRKYLRYRECCAVWRGRMPIQASSSGIKCAINVRS